MSTTATYNVTGMTCGHCVGAVTEELLKVPGVRAVEVDLQPEAASVIDVTSDSPLDAEVVAAAIDEAGYELSRG